MISAAEGAAPARGVKIRAIPRAIGEVFIECDQPGE
jgi:hypothetical protein